ncbi:YbhB/YbcL family Raf kinase inhibitor-like protein [Stomatohabitans albus]|uniref:YbhB/YbcL family Raf kinase inhibitor-like protein n=1 Tax=Stomatohabitans albus TaxID=3110766 RepID=UPI00300D5ADE
MGPNLKSITLSSPDLAHGQPIEKRFTHEGNDDIPRLVVAGVPSDAVELAVIMHDPDAPWTYGFVHWTAYGIPTDVSELTPEVLATARTGPNETGDHAYLGPYPPPGHGTHHYFFEIYALDRKVEGEPTRDEFMREYAGNVIDQARICGTYERHE